MSQRRRVGRVGCCCFTSLCVFYSLSRLWGQSIEANSDPALQARPLYQETQQALDNLARAETAREEASSNLQSLEPVRQQLRAVIGQLKSMETQLASLLRTTYQHPPSAQAKLGWSVQELESLLRNLSVQQARAYRNQALCYSDESVDRINALSLALQQLSDVVTLPLDEPSVWQARIDQVVCLRLAGDSAEARKRVDQWFKASPPAKIASRLRGESLRNDLKEGAVKQALATVAAHLANEQQRAAAVPETDDVILEVLLIARQQAGPGEARPFTQQVTRQLQHIAVTHDLFWKRRAEIRIGRALAKSNSDHANTDDPELLIHAAASFFAAGKLPESVAIYDRVAELLAAQGDTKSRFQVLKTAAAVVQEAETSAAALKRFRKLALEYREHAEAAATHLIAIGLAATLARERDGAQRGGQFELYLELLQEHLHYWPQEPSAKTVKSWMARTQLPEVQRQRARSLASLGERQQALEIYAQLLKASPRDPELLEASAQLLGSGSSQPERDQAMQLWQQIEKRSKPGGPRWLRGRRARLELLEQLGEGERAKRLRQLTEILYPRFLD